MSPKEEELEKRKKLLGDYILASRKELEEDLQRIDDLSKAVGNFFDAFYKLSEANKKEFMQFRADYRKFFLYELQQRAEYRDQLAFVSEQVTDLKLRIGDAKADDHRFNQKKLENVLNDIVLPFKTELLEMVRLENEVGKLRKEEAPPVMAEVRQTEKEIPVKEITEEIKNTPVPETTEAVLAEEIPEDSVPLKVTEEIFIPVTLTDKPLKTKTGKPLNNPAHVAGGRKFSWSDPRIPDLIGDFLLERQCILDYQLKVVQEFFMTTRSDRKIVFDGNANQLTTLFYDLKTAKHMTIFVNYLGEIIEAVFVKKGNTLQPLIVRKSLVADLKKGSVPRRLKIDSPYYLDILSYLDGKLKKE